MDDQPATTPAPPARVLVARFVGDGSEYQPGIPARDLFAEDWAELDADTRQRARTSGLYRFEPPFDQE